MILSTQTQHIRLEINSHDFASVYDEDGSGELLLHSPGDGVHLEAVVGVRGCVHRHQEVVVVVSAEAVSREVEESVSARHTCQQLVKPVQLRLHFRVSEIQESEHFEAEGRGYEHLLQSQDIVFWCVELTQFRVLVVVVANQQSNLLPSYRNK